MEYPTEPIVNKGELPDPFTVPGGRRISSRQEWPPCAAAWRDLIVATEYGGMPPRPEKVEFETLCRSAVARWEGSPNFWSCKIHCAGGEKPISFAVQILFPSTDRPVPAIINGDRCWWSISDEVARAVVDNGCALVLFNRTETAEDLGYRNCPEPDRRTGGLWDVYPGRTFGALAAWAWAYHRCVDLLHALPFIDNSRIAVTGHSRGGKATLIAGATDERIALVNDNGSCAGGSAAFRYVGHGGETLNIVNVYPSWFGKDIRQYSGREDELPFDQHCLLAAIAPRPLLLTYALDDRWSNPEGMVICAQAARKVYDFLGKPDALAFHLRPGKHRHAPEDWQVLLDFIGTHWQGKEPPAACNQHPYTHLKPMFSWRQPAVQPL
ncbi:MAG: hypothetical protein GX591_04040 [Planctomycetes bacterium]|nr:hypothetical protein [Planctomycetota bacterium]